MTEPDEPEGGGPWQRKPERPEDQVLSLRAETFFGSLPDEVYPHALIERFPRIANEIARRYGDREQLVRYFRSLLTDERGGRKGFPFQVLMDIENLKTHLLGDEHGEVNLFWD